jgi:hephaestin
MNAKANNLSQPQVVKRDHSSERTRTVYLAAEELDWNYAPTGSNQITGQPFGDLENTFVATGPDRIGSIYHKAHFVEYTDASFSVPKSIGARWRHLGILGPAIHAEVGDTIKVVFRNNTTIPTSVHPHGVFYTKDGSEGAPYNDGLPPKLGDAVPPGGSFTYIWSVPERAGPAPGDGSSVFWMYHSHVDEVTDTNAGLIGPLIITARGKAKRDGAPDDVDREFVTMFKVFNENVSPYLDYNIQTFSGNPSSVNVDDGDFQESNLMHSINGYVYGNLDVNDLTMKKGERVRWYMLSVGTEVDLHTPHWHGNTGTFMQMRMDMIELLPGSMKVFDMKPDDVGIWYYHCHVDDHILAGMQARYRVNP